MAYYASIAAAESDGLIHYWPMNEQSGDSVVDIIGGWNGKLVGVNTAPSATDIANSIVSSPSGSGRDLGARYTSDTTELMPIELTPPAPSLSPLSAITARIRFYLTSEEFGSLSSWSPFGLAVGTAPVWFAQYGDSFGLEYEYGTRSDNLASTNPFVIGQWNELVISANSAGASFYVNGTEIFSTTLGSSAYEIYRLSGSAVVGWIGARNFSFGTLGDSYSRANIIVQDFAIWNRALTPSEMEALNTAGHTEELTPPPPVDVSFDVPAPVSADFLAYSDGYAGFVVAAPITSNFDVFQDWTQALNSLLLQEAYEMVLTGSENGLDDLTIPISSWQATNQSGGRSAYLQAVIPGADIYISEIEARPDGSLVIRKGLRLPSGESQFSEILRSDFDSLRYDRSGNRFTVTISGRRLNATPASGTRTLTGVRTISVTNGKHRARCDIDLFLRPGMMVVADDVTFQAGYINYYVNQTDKFCEVGEQ